MCISIRRKKYGASWGSWSSGGECSASTAVLQLFCSAAWPAPLPLSTFTAFLGFYCLCRLLLNQSTVADFVDFYCLCRLLQPLSTFTAFVGLHCLCLIFLSLSAMLTLTTGCRNLLIVSSILLCNLTFGFLQTLSLYRDRSNLVYIYIYIYISCIAMHWLLYRYT